MEGSNLSGVTSKCTWEESSDSHTRNHDDYEEDKENRLLDGDRRGNSESGDRQRLSQYGEYMYDGPSWAWAWPC